MVKIVKKMDMRRIWNVLILAMLFVVTSCIEDGYIEQGALPVIDVDSHYVVRAGEEVVINPTYDFVDNTTIYSWAMGLTVLSTEPTLRHTFTQVGSYNVTLYVTNFTGTNYADIRIDVVESEKPLIELAGAAEGFRIAEGAVLRLLPSVRQTPATYSYSWKVDGNQVAETLSYDFVGETVGTHTLRFDVFSNYGDAFIEFEVEVCKASDMPFEWGFEQSSYSVPVNRELLIMAYGINADIDSYEWRVNGELVATTTEPKFRFSSDVTGAFAVEPSAICGTGDERTVHQTRLTVKVCQAEGTYRRPRQSTSSRHWNKVYQYMPGPGQFINDTSMGGFKGNETTEAAAIAYAEKRLHQELNSTANTFVSLGSFGGYIVVGFDHSIDSSSGDYDFVIRGNAFEGSSEPGIVYVMQDENGDGQPNDTWYELAGSDRLSIGTTVGYSVTYYRPTHDQMAVAWRDNQGNAGEVNYLPSYHKQASYFPAWITADSYTLRGTRLKERVALEGSKWIQAAFEWGYADNFSTVDRPSGSESQAGGITANRFRISDAVYADGTPINLKYIDFVKVQTAGLANCGELGELSTEIFGIYEIRTK